MPFLKTLVTVDEKWIVYDNVMRKRSWCLRNESPKQQPKKDIYVKKTMFCVWWDFKEIIYYEIFPQNQTINSDVSCRQLSNLAEKLERLRPELANRKGVVFQQDNVRLHVFLATRTKLHKLD